jgi:colanic acid biosynthesis glycosyl transferase WcaI
VILCGEGAQREHLREMIRQHRLDNVTMLPLQPDTHYREMLVDADLCVITQQRGSGGYFFPSKLLTTLAWEKPVLTVADEESDLVGGLRQGNFGINIEPDQPEKLARAIQHLSVNREQLREYAVAGRRYVAQFAMEQVLDDFTAELEKLVPTDDRLGSARSTVSPAERRARPAV